MKTDADQTLKGLQSQVYKEAPIGLCCLDTNLRYVHINHWLAAINGLSVEEHLGRTVGEVLPHVAAGIESQLRHVIETGEPILGGTVVAETPANPGEKKCFEHNYYPVKSGGSIVGVSCAIQDITDRKRAEEALCKARDELEMRVKQRTTELEEAIKRLRREFAEREQVEEARQATDERFRLLLESTCAVPWVADASTWRFTYVGPQIVTLFGYPVGNWYEQDFWVEHIHPDDRKWAVDFCQKSSQQLQDYDFQYRMLASDERIVWIHDIVNVKAGADGVPTMLQGFMIDITEQKRADRQFRDLLESAPDATVIIDDAGEIALVNAQTTREFGYARDELLGQPVEILIPQRFREAHQSHRRRYFADPIPRAMGAGNDLYGLRKDGTDFPVEISLSTLKTNTGMLVSAAIRNITERKQAEQALKQNREELRTLTGKLLTVQEVERQRIARELHDDISQRLAALTMDTAKIEEQLSVSPQLIPERLHELQANIVEIAQDVHGLSRQLHPSILEDLGLVRALRSKCKTVADREGMAVELTADGDFDELSADQALCLYRIVQESLRNIAKHAHTKSARVALAQRDGMALLTIEDEGIGFEREGARAGSGLGLVSMEERVRLCGGQFSVQSTRGKGTRVEVRISFETNGDESSTITPG